jgi:hypothetical protein
MIAKIGVSVLFGLVAFAASQELNPSAEGPTLLAVGTSVFVSGVAFVVQFLIEVEGRIDTVRDAMDRVEMRYDAHSRETDQMIREEFKKINEATDLFGAVEASALNTDAMTQLVRNSTKVVRGERSLVSAFAQAEINRLSSYLKALGQGADLTYEGADRDWLLGLTRVATVSIDATSLTTVDAGGRGFVDGGLWTSDLGQQYLSAQQDAIRRRVAIRRIFIFDRPDLEHDKDLVTILRQHALIGVQVRTLNPVEVAGPGRESFVDFIVIDGVLSYQTTPASRVKDGPPIIATTTLVTDPDRVKQRIDRYQELWDLAKVYSVPVIPTQPTRSSRPA